MTTDFPRKQAPDLDDSILEWLLESDPSIRWQVMWDLIGAPQEQVAAERARVAHVAGTRCEPCGY